MAITKTQSIRTIYWFNFLSKKLNIPSALGIQRVIDPGSIRMVADKEISHSSKWAEYRRGIHSPRKNIIDRAETKVRGSSNIFNHLLWEILEREKVAEDFNELYKKLKPEIQLLIIDNHGKVNTRASKQFLGKFERRASLESLAALTLLLKYNYEMGYSERAWEYAHSIFRVLLILGNHFGEYGVAETVFDLFDQRIFSLVSWNNRKFCFKDFRYHIASELLFTITWTLMKEALNRITPAQQTMLMLNIIKYEDNPKFKRLFNPPTVQIF